MPIYRMYQRRRNSFAAVMSALSVDVLYRFNETSGTTVINYGTLGSGNATWTPGAGALGQSDSMGANEAYLFDAAASRVVGPTSATINNAAIFTVGLKVKATSSGEATNGYLWADNGGNRIISITSGGASPYLVSFGVWCSTMQALAVTTSGSGIILNQEMWVFGTFDNTGDRKPRIYFGYNGAVAEAAETLTAGTDTLANASGALLVGDNSSSIRSWGGLIGEFFFKAGSVLTTNNMTDIVRASYT